MVARKPPRPRPLRTLPAVLTILLIHLAALPPAAAQESGREVELEQIRDQITALRMQLGRLQDREAGLSGELRRTELELRLQEKRVDEARAERALAEAALAEAIERVEALEQRLEQVRAELRLRLFELYRLGHDGSLRLLLAIRSQEHLLPGIRIMRSLARRHAELIDSYLDRRTTLDFERDELVGRRLRVEEAARRESQRLGALWDLRERQSRLLARVESERASVAARTERLVDKERKLANLLDFLYGRTTAPLVGTPMQNFRGVLDWPIRGSVVRRFGPRLDPRYQTLVPHNGIDIQTEGDGRVKAIFPGRVVFAAPFQGFGLTAVVHHPERVFTLYAGLRELNVAQEDVLTLGAVVGLAGETLYFEIRVHNRPQDPLTWLR